MGTIVPTEQVQVSEQGAAQRRRVLPVVIVGIILAGLCGLSWYFRVTLAYDQIFVNGAVWFRETDAYYYMRHIENMIHNFPHFNAFDPYQLYPGGAAGLLRPFFAWLVAGIILLASGGAPTQHFAETVAAYMPAILGTLTLIPVYFIGKELFNRWVGVFSAALVIMIPGELMHRSLLGFTDHHVAETLFSTVCMLFLIMAVRRAQQRGISFAHVIARDWLTLRKPLIYTLLAGIFLGIYLLSWAGGLLLVLVIVAYLVIQFVIDHLRRRSTDYLCIIGAPVLLVGFLIVLPVLGTEYLDTVYRVSMPIAIAIPIALSGISHLMTRKAWKPIYYPVALLGLAGIGLVAFHAIKPALFQSILGLFRIFTPGGAMLTVMEVSPLLFPYGQFSFMAAWANFNTSFFIAFVSIGMLIYVAIKGKDADKILFLVWSILMLMAVLGQRRFAYYYTVNAALLTGYFCWKMLDLAGLRKLLAAPRATVQAAKTFKKKEKHKHKAKPRTVARPARAWVGTIVVGIILVFVVFLPNVGMAKALGSAQNIIMDQGWYSSLLWLKDNSPEPFFGDPNFYYALYPPKDKFEYPETAYGVMSWWDYGHCIMRIAHRVPNANPGQANADKAGMFFTAQNEAEASEILKKYGLNSKYVMIDYATATSKFYAMARWAGKTEEDFFGVYYLPTSTGFQQVYLFYPTYYSSIVARLYNFDGRAVSPAQPLVISYEETDYQGNKYRQITWGDYFPSYEEAQAFVANQTSGNYVIGGIDPFQSVVPLEELTTYRLVYQSGPTTNSTTVKIFEYLGSSES